MANKYGQKFLKSLPPMKRTREQTLVIEFLKSLSAKESIDTDVKEQRKESDD
jgi:ATP-dependent DNA helicase DinG